MLHIKLKYTLLNNYVYYTQTHLCIIKIIPNVFYVYESKTIMNNINQLLTSQVPKLKRETKDHVSTIFFGNGVLHSGTEPALVEVDEKGNIIKSEYYYMGMLHCYDKYKCRYVSDEGKRIVEKVFQYNELHSNNDLPSVVCTVDGVKSYEEWHKEGVLFRKNDLPAKKFYSKSGSLEKDVWHESESNVLRNFNFPTKVTYYTCGKIHTQKWIRNSLKHRDDDSPSVISYDKLCNISAKKWYKEGMLHRDNDLPAVQYFFESKLTSEVWYNKGKVFSNNYFDRRSINNNGVFYYYKGDVLVKNEENKQKQETAKHTVDCCSEVDENVDCESTEEDQDYVSVNKTTLNTKDSQAIFKLREELEKELKYLSRRQLRIKERTETVKSYLQALDNLGY